MGLYDNPFPGVTELKFKADKKKEKKRIQKIEKGGIICTCGVLSTNYTSVSYLHFDHCIINRKKS